MIACGYHSSGMKCHQICLGFTYDSKGLGGEEGIFFL